MGSRALVTITGLCFFSAGILALLGVAALAGATPVAPGLVVFLAAIVLALAGMQLRVATRQVRGELGERGDQVRLLRGQLEEQKAAVDALADSLDIAIFICDPRATVLYANRIATELFRHESVQGRSILAVTLSHDLERLVLDAVRLKEPQRTELTFTFPEERVAIAKAWASAASSPRVFLSVYDITDLRRLERVRQDFVANVSHELRTPLTIIRSMAETLLDDAEADEATRTRYLTSIVTEVDRLSSITQDLLVLSAAESNPVRKQVCDIADVFRTMASRLSAKAQEKGLELRYRGPGRFLIEANAAQMGQVAINLIDNAINYTMRGAIEVEVEPRGETVTVRVIDSGIGISSEHVDRIFERFYRVDKARSRATGGTGLGLSIVKHIVEAHGGSVHVESNLNQGSVFTVELPVGDVIELPVEAHRS